MPFQFPKWLGGFSTAAYRSSWWNGTWIIGGCEVTGAFVQRPVSIWKFRSLESLGQDCTVYSSVQATKFAQSHLQTSDPTKRNLFGIGISLACCNLLPICGTMVAIWVTFGTQTHGSFWGDGDLLTIEGMKSSQSQFFVEVVVLPILYTEISCSDFPKPF